VPGRLWRWLLPRVPGAVGVVLVALAGGVIGAVLAPATDASVGPLQVQVRVVPSLDPGVRLLLPPAGQVEFATHHAPWAIEGSIAQVDLDGARALIDSPGGVGELSDTAIPQLRSAAIRAAVTSVLCGVLGAVVLGAVVYRRAWRRTAQVACTVIGALLATAGMAAGTADPARLAQPRFTGLLSQAPYIAGQVPNVLDRLESYRSGLADIVSSVTALYATAGRLPTSAGGTTDVITVLHVSDIHLNPLAYDLIGRLIPQFGVDVVIDTGDITTWGTDAESSTLRRIRELKVPYVFVRGNHDSARTAQAVAANPNAVVLADQVVQVAGLTVAGIGDPEFTPDQDTPPPSTPASTSSPTPSPTPTPTPSASAPLGGAGVPGGPGVAGPDGEGGPQLVNNQRLASTVRTWDSGHAGAPVQIAAVHEPKDLEPLLGEVPTIMAGHLHTRSVRVDASGTRVMVEGSTGGAGITANGLNRLADGQPVPLSASLVHYAKTGPRAGSIVAIDAITVGGFGLASVNLQRTVVQQDPPLQPAVPVPAPSPSGTPATTSPAPRAKQP
jgi:hypothetical protein